MHGKSHKIVVLVCRDMASKDANKSRDKMFIPGRQRNDM